MKEKMMKMLNELKTEEKNLRAAIIDGATKEERMSAQEALDKVLEKIADINAIIAEVDAPGEPAAEPTGEPAGEGARAFNPLATMTVRAAAPAASDLEQRKAFQQFMAYGKRADATTKTTDSNVSTVIPENLITRILEKYEQLGVIYNEVTKTSYPVGQTIPVDGVKPTATWVGRNSSSPSSSTSGEGATSDAQNKMLSASIVFAHYKLRCEIRYTEEVATMTLPAFEELFVKQVGEAMLRALEYAVVEGDGNGMPTGILNYTPDTGKAITIAEDATGTKLTYDKLCECEAALPAEYEGNAKWVMTKKTFMSFIGMVDSNGQPIARVNYGIGGKPERTLLGRDVILYVPQAGSKLKDFTSGNITEDTLVAFIFDFKDYVLNTNYDLGIQHARDWDNEDHKTKAVQACDGKVIDKGSLVTLTIDAA